MAEESIVHEVRRIKEELARKHAFDVRKIGQAMMAAQKKSGRKVVSLKAKHRGNRTSR